MTDQHRIASAAELRRLYGRAEGLAAKKSLPKLDRHARDYIARSPFLCIATSGEGGAPTFRRAAITPVSCKYRMTAPWRSRTVQATTGWTRWRTFS